MQPITQKEIDEIGKWCLLYGCQLRLPPVNKNLNPFVMPSKFSINKQSSLDNITVPLMINGYSFLYNEEGHLEIIGVHK
jgi:hypothetical protein